MHILARMGQSMLDSILRLWREMVVMIELYLILRDRKLPFDLYEPLVHLSQVTFLLDDYSRRRYRIFTDGFLDRSASDADRHGDRKVFIKSGTWAIVSVDGVRGWRITNVWVTPAIRHYAGLASVLDRFASPEKLEELKKIAEEIAPKEAVHCFDGFNLFTANYCLDRRDDPGNDLKELKTIRSGV